MKRLLAATLLSLSIQLSAQDQWNLRPKIFALTVPDVHEATAWYTETLDFEKDTISHFASSGITVGFMHMGDFYLELVSFEKTHSKKSLKLPKAHSNLHGYFKMGFQSSNIDKLYQELTAKSVNVIAPIGNLPAMPEPSFPKRYFLIEDPYGNYIQLFSDGSENKHLTPFLMAISTPDIDEAIKWYENNLGARTLGTKVGQQGNERVLLSVNGFLIELGEFADDVDYNAVKESNDIGRWQIQGPAKLSWMTDDIQSMNERFKQAGAGYDFELTERKSLAGDRYFMIQDLFGNSLQFFEKDN